MYLFQLFDFYAASGTALLWVAFFECTIVGWVYGSKRFVNDMKRMMGYKIGPWLQLCWMALGPAFTAAIFFFTLVMYEPLKYNGTYVYPTWGYVLGWGMAVASMIQIPLYAIYRLVRAEGTLKERWTTLTTPINVPVYGKSKLHDTSFYENVVLNVAAPDELGHGTFSKPVTVKTMEQGTSTEDN